MPVMAVIYEVCVETPEGACTAARGGAGRVELCSDLPRGGVTPSIGAVRQAVDRCPVPVVVLIRPRVGDFVMDRYDLATAVEDIAVARMAGAAGVAIGALTPDGSIDRDIRIPTRIVQ